MHAITASSTPKPYEYTKRSTRSLVDPLLSMAVVAVPIEFREGTGRLRRTGLSRHAPRCLSKTRVPRRRTSVVSHRSRFRVLRGRVDDLGSRRLSEVVLPSALGSGLRFRIWRGCAGCHGAQVRGILRLPRDKSEPGSCGSSRVDRPWRLSVSGSHEPVLPSGALGRPHHSRWSSRNAGNQADYQCPLIPRHGAFYP